VQVVFDEATADKATLVPTASNVTSLQRHRCHQMMPLWNRTQV
jgi:hypothetical protein